MRIAILGANGQVGTEVCLYLQHCNDVDVVAVCRSEFASSVLRRLNIDCRIGDIASERDAPRLVGDCDLVADFTLPSGGVREAVAAHRAIISQTQNGMKAGASFVFISSQMAFGMSDRRRVLRDYWLSDTAYGATKRAAEKTVKRISNKHRRSYYILRLGQVHGIIQPVSLAMSNQLRDSVRVVRVPDGPSYTIFCYSIAEALVNIAHGRERAGTTFSAVSNPAWSWQEVVEHLGASTVKLTPMPPKRSVSLKRIIAPMTSLFKGLIVNRKEFVQAHLLRYTPNFEYELKTRNWCSLAKQGLTDLDRYHNHDLVGFQGELPGPRLQSLSDSRKAMGEISRICNEAVESLVDEPK